MLAERRGGDRAQGGLVVLQRLVYPAQRAEEYAQRRVGAHDARAVAALFGQLHGPGGDHGGRVGAAGGVQTVGRGPETGHLGQFGRRRGDAGKGDEQQDEQGLHEGADTGHGYRK